MSVDTRSPVVHLLFQGGGGGVALTRTPVDAWSPVVHLLFRGGGGGGGGTYTG